MTDFLTRLAQRTLGLTPVVQPQIASRYVPAAEVMIANDYISSAPSNLEPASTSATAPEQVITAQTPTESLHVHTSPSLSSAEPRLPLAQMETTISSPTPLINSFSNSEQNSSLVTSDASSPKTFPSGFGRNNNTETSLTGSLEPPKNHSEHSPSSSQPPFAPAANSPENSPDDFLPPSNKGFKSQSNPLLPKSPIRPEQKLELPPAIANSSSLPLVNIQEANIRSTLVTQDGSKQSGFPSTQSSLVQLSSSATTPIKQPEPTIEIRIGRIEVRGLQPKPSKPHPKSTPAAPALSLSDYLNQRDGGKP
jgi:hypothetical protein